MSFQAYRPRKLIVAALIAQRWQRVDTFVFHYKPFRTWVLEGGIHRVFQRITASSLLFCDSCCHREPQFRISSPYRQRQFAAR